MRRRRWACAAARSIAACKSMGSDLEHESPHEILPWGKPPRKRRLNYDKQILLITLLISIPPAFVAELLLWLSDHSSELKWTLTLFIVLAWAIGSSVLHGAVIRPLQTLSNMVAAIREEDFSFRVRGGSREDSLADLIYEINSLAGRLQAQKVSAL